MTLELLAGLSFAVLVIQVCFLFLIGRRVEEMWRILKDMRDDRRMSAGNPQSKT